MIRDTYRAAGLDLDTTRFFEAHGPGTPVGDPLEAFVIGAVFSSSRSREEPLYFGALKSNVCHLEAASDIAGLIKSVLVLERGTIPPNIWFETPNPKILLDDWNIKVGGPDYMLPLFANQYFEQFPIQPTPWPSSGLRRASVNSFGFGGSNVHVVLDDAYHYLTLRNLNGRHHTVENPPDLRILSLHPSNRQLIPQVNGMAASLTNSFPKKSPMLLFWSVFDEGGIKRLTSLYREHLAGTPKASNNDSTYFEDLVYTLWVKRSSLSWKSFAVADSTMGLQRGLENGMSRPTRSSHVPTLAFLFNGQGAQWPGMGTELLIIQDLGRASIRQRISSTLLAVNAIL